MTILDLEEAPPFVEEFSSEKEAHFLICSRTSPRRWQIESWCNDGEEAFRRAQELIRPPFMADEASISIIGGNGNSPILLSRILV